MFLCALGLGTSVLVAWGHRAHPLHDRAVVWIDAVAEGRGSGLAT
ncbi:hypothetical protein [Sorangium sp. So ce1182]